MNQTDARAWLEDLLNTFPKLRKDDGTANFSGIERWTASVSTALAAVFPPGHPVHKQWDPRASELRGNPGLFRISEVIDACKGILESAAEIVRDGRLSSLVDGVRAETVFELLDQADELVAAKHAVPAAVIAGGALETFLHFLCTKNGRTWQGHGMIEKYKNALVADPPILDKGDGKNVTGWGDTRNRAAHTPSEFDRTDAEVRLMIEGIRQFIMRRS